MTELLSRRCRKSARIAAGSSSVLPHAAATFRYSEDLEFPTEPSFEELEADQAGSEQVEAGDDVEAPLVADGEPAEPAEPGRGALRRQQRRNGLPQLIGNQPCNHAGQQPPDHQVSS